MGGEIRIIDRKISKIELKDIASERYGDMVKGVVDIEKEVVALGGELHADEEAVLLDMGSKQENLWGINLYPEMDIPDCLEYDSMINIRPNQGNKSRGVEDEKVREKIVGIIDRLIE